MARSSSKHRSRTALTRRDMLTAEGRGYGTGDERHRRRRVSLRIGEAERQQPT